jgi:predicted PurR-regulated permease PerM
VFPRDRYEPRFITWVRNPDVRRTLILSSLWLFLAVVLVMQRAVLLPFGLALLLAFIVEPWVQRMSEREVFGRPLKRAGALGVIFVVSLGVISTFSIWALAQIGRELAGLRPLTKRLVAEAKAGIRAFLDWSEAFAVENSLPLERAEIEAVLQNNLVGALEEFSNSTAELLNLGRDLVSGAFGVVFGGFLVLMLTSFLSADRFRIERFFQSLVPFQAQGAYRTILAGISRGLSGVVRGQILICLTNGVLTFIGLWLLDVKLPLILATIATAFSLIPIFGSILSSIPIVAMALIDSFGKAVLTLAWIIGIHLIEGNVLNPKIMGETAKIHPVVVVFALIVGERTGGLMGALFAVPIAAVVQTVFIFLKRRALDEPGTLDLPALRPEALSEPPPPASSPRPEPRPDRSPVPGGSP